MRRRFLLQPLRPIVRGVRGVGLRGVWGPHCRLVRILDGLEWHAVEALASDNCHLRRWPYLYIFLWAFLRLAVQPDGTVPPPLGLRQEGSTGEIDFVKRFVKKFKK